MPESKEFELVARPERRAAIENVWTSLNDLKFLTENSISIDYDPIQGPFFTKKCPI